MGRIHEAMIQFILCHIFGAHDWTCNANEGIKPTPEQIAAGVDGFNDYAKGYCRHCKKLLKGRL